MKVPAEIQRNNLVWNSPHFPN